MDNPSSERRNITSILGVPIDAIWLLSFNTWFISIESPWFHLKVLGSLALACFSKLTSYLPCVSQYFYPHRNTLHLPDNQVWDFLSSWSDFCLFFASYNPPQPLRFWPTLTPSIELSWIPFPPSFFPLPSLVIIVLSFRVLSIVCVYFTLGISTYSLMLESDLLYRQSHRMMLGSE